MGVLERQIVDTETGEVKSRGKLGQNSNFVMLFRNEISSIVQIQKTDPKAGALFMFFLEHMDQENALLVSRETMSEILGWSVETIKRKIKVLKDLKFIDVLKSGTSNVYVINANIAWTTYGNKKDYAKFRASVLVSRTEQEYKAKTSKFKQLDLLGKEKNE